MSPPQKRARQQKPSPAASEPEGPDLIDRLSDCVLSSILSLLPVKEAARTSVLSSRWRHVWKEAPLHLDDSSIEPDELTLVFNHLEWSRNAVSRIVGSHHGPIETLRLSRFGRPQFHRAMDRIVESAAQRGLRELTLVSDFDFFDASNTYLLPPSLLRCNSLLRLSIDGCRFPHALALPPSIFPNLKELRLTTATLHNDSLQVLLSSSRSLETLHFFSFVGPRLFSISSASLRKLVWDTSLTIELIIKDAPNLESLMFSHRTTKSCKVKVLDAPKLQLLGILSVGFKALQLGGTFFEREVQAFH